METLRYVLKVHSLLVAKAIPNRDFLSQRDCGYCILNFTDPAFVFIKYFGLRWLHNSCRAIQTPKHQTEQVNRINEMFSDREHLLFKEYSF